MCEYEGWKNKQTWNVALWVNNEEPLYRAAVDYVRRVKTKGRKPTWIGFVKSVDLHGDRTPDGIAWASTRLDCKALNAMLDELLD